MSHSGEFSVSRVFDVPRELVYRAFADPDQLGQWFGPAGFLMPFETVQSDVRAGGFLRFVLVSDADPSRRTPVDVALSEVVENELLVAHADIGPVAGTGRTARIRPGCDWNSSTTPAVRPGSNCARTRPVTTYAAIKGRPGRPRSPGSTPCCGARCSDGREQ